MDIREINYNRADVESGILHFGVGNFHRAHLECFTNRLLEMGGSKDWGVCGAMLMPSDEPLYRKLKSQDGIYSLTVCGRDGVNRVEWIGSMVELLWSGEDLEAIINKVADPKIRIITMTITEGGYNLDSDAVRDDLLSPSTPKSIFGVIAEGLRRRAAAGAGCVTILSCDNLQHNGDTAKAIFTSFFSQQDAMLESWVEQNVTFPNSMVDRITPATLPADVERLNIPLDKSDLVPVFCEDYIEWVVEDNFASDRPEWQSVGVEFTHDVSSFETMKLSLLNASHTLLSYPSMLCGYRRVDEAMRDERIVKFVRDFMDSDASPYVPTPENRDLELYKTTLIERFANRAVGDQISRLCSDGVSKFPVYVMPIVEKMVASGADLRRIAYLIAAYRHFLKYRTDDRGDHFEIFEPAITESDLELVGSSKAIKFLSASPFSMVDLAYDRAFVDLYLDMVEAIKEMGAMSVLESLIKS